MNVRRHIFAMTLLAGFFMFHANAQETWTLDQCMQKMVAQHKISREDAAARAVNKDLFR